MWCDGCNPDNCSGCWDPDVERHTVKFPLVEATEPGIVRVKAGDYRAVIDGDLEVEEEQPVGVDGEHIVSICKQAKVVVRHGTAWFGSVERSIPPGTYTVSAGELHHG